jgi:hypothetical protein
LTPQFKHTLILFLFSDRLSQTVGDCQILNALYIASLRKSCQRDGICSIGSGAVESGIKQIVRRIKISGASWKSEHVGQVLAHRCAYLNGLIGKSRKAA